MRRTQVALALVGLAAFTAGLRRGRAVERAMANRRLHDTVLPALDAIALLAGPGEVKRLAREYAADLRKELTRPGRRRSASLTEDLADVAEELRRHGLTVRLDTRTNLVPSPERREALRAAAAEALRNTVRHSGVREADLTVEPRHGGLAVIATDAGTGFDMATYSPGFGISESIVARMAEVGGSATIESRAGTGTRVTLWIPA
jgi:signal transduction histidine kinase